MDHRLGLTAGSALKAGALALPPPVRTRPVEAGLDLDGLGRHLTGEPLKPQDEGAGKEAEGGEQGHRIVRAPQEVGGADASEGQGLAGADGDAPEIEPPQPLASTRSDERAPSAKAAMVASRVSGT
jgi:hypothetical protein